VDALKRKREKLKAVEEANEKSKRIKKLEEQLKLEKAAAGGGAGGDDYVE
jgi:hypothetical protein